MSGLFITMEGTDGAGKSTQLELLKNYFEDRGFCVTCVREPGSTPIGEKIREIIIDKNNKEMCNATEALLYAAARAQLVNEVIAPVLKRGDIVLADRFLDSSLVYQGYARGMGSKTITDINKYAVGELVPDLTIFLKLSPEEGIERKKQQAELDRMEAQKQNFHKRVYDGYIRLSKADKNRIKVVNAVGDVDVIHNKIVAYVENLLNEREI
jgi:dTMP kinase